MRVPLHSKPEPRQAKPRQAKPDQAKPTHLPTTFIICSRRVSTPPSRAAKDTSTSGTCPVQAGLVNDRISDKRVCTSLQEEADDRGVTPLAREEKHRETIGVDIVGVNPSVEGVLNNGWVSRDAAHLATLLELDDERVVVIVAESVRRGGGLGWGL